MIADRASIAVADAQTRGRGGRVRRGPESWRLQGGMGQLRRGLVSGTAHEVAPLGTARLRLRSVDLVSRHMRSLVAQHLQEQIAGGSLKPGAETDDPGRGVDATEGSRHPTGKGDLDQTRKLGRPPRASPIGENLRVVRRFARHSLP
jgi:hypothetical protein